MNTKNKVLWSLVLLLMLIDVGTTAHGLKQPNVEESNPVVRAVVQGIGVVPAMALFKGGAVGIGAIAYYLLPKHKWVAPAGLIVGTLPTLYNLYVLFIA